MGSKRVALASCILQRRRDLKEILGISWDDMCIVAAVGMSVECGTPANMSTIASLTTIDYATTRRRVKKLVEDKWITRVEQHPYDVYIRTTDPDRWDQLLKFVDVFMKGMDATSCKLFDR